MSLMHVSTLPDGTTSSSAAHGAIVVRQFSLWPFGTRTVRLCLLLDPGASQLDASLQRGVLRAMQDAYFRAGTGSQTNAVRAAALAAHYVLRHHNRDALPPDQVTSSGAVAVVRGGVAYVGLLGEAAVFAFRAGSLAGRRGDPRVTRPLGLEQEPRLTFWSTRVQPGDRLVLVCGGQWPARTADVVADVLSNTSAEAVEEGLAEALTGANGRPRVLLAEPPLPGRHEHHVGATGQAPAARRPTAHPVSLGGAARRWLTPVVPLLVMGVTMGAALNPNAEQPRAALAQEAESLVGEVQAASDMYSAHQLATTALDLASRAAAVSPEYTNLVEQVRQVLDGVDRVYPIQPAMAVRLGPSGNNVVDLAVASDALYTLDGVEASVRAFDVEARDQTPTPGTLLMRRGAQVGGRRLSTPVAMQYVANENADGALTVVDDARTVVQLGHDGSVNARVLPSSGAWRELGGIGADPSGSLFVLDRGARRILQYPRANQRLADPPRPLAEWSPTPERAADILPLDASTVFLRMDDGSIWSVDEAGNARAFVVRPPDGRPVAAASMAADRAGGLYLADPSSARIVQAGVDGSFVRQLRDPALAGVRQIQSSPDGRRLFGLVAGGVLVFDLPPDVPASVPRQTE